MLCLASVLYNAGYARYREHHLTDDEGYDVFDVERHKKYAEWQEAIKLYEKLLMSLGEYENLGEKEKAKQIADNSPDISICRELLMVHCSDGKKCVEIYEKTLAKIVSAASDLLASTVMANRNHYCPEKAVAKIQSAIQLFDILENKDQYWDQIVNLYLYLSEYQWKAKNQNEAFNSLENAKELAQNYDNINNLDKATGVTAQLPDA